MVVDHSWFEHSSAQLKLIEHYDHETKRARLEFDEARRLIPRWIAEFDNDVHREQSVGDLRLKKIHYLLDHAFDHMGWQRSEAQVEFHDAFIIACLPKIYGDEWESQSSRVMAEFGITEIKQLVLAITPRRFGKSTGVGCFVAVLLYVVPAITAATFSTGKRASGLLMEVLMRILTGIPGAKERICKQSAEQLVLSEAALGHGVGTQSESAKRMATDARSSTFHSYPSNPDGQQHIHTHTAHSPLP